MKLTWRVEPAPTGIHRSFHQRSWPMAHVDPGEHPVARLTCDVGYDAARCRQSDHGPITVHIAQYHHPSKVAELGAFTWRAMKQKFHRLDLAKAGAQQFVDRNPDFFKHLKGEQDA